VLNLWNSKTEARVKRKEKEEKRRRKRSGLLLYFSWRNFVGGSYLSL
jgi:hypothetical protein